MGLFLFGIRIPAVFFLILVGLAWRNARRWAGAGWSHGTARLAQIHDLLRSNMLGHDGLLLGTTGLMRPSFREGVSALFSAVVPPDLACYLFLAALGGSRWVKDRMIRITTFTHLLTCAPTGTGKGISVLIPNLRSYPHSCVVTDPKAELFIKSASFRYFNLQNRIHRLDPFAIGGPGTDRFNPLDMVDDTAPDFLDQCRDIADMMIMQSGKEPDPYWNDSARGVLTAFIAYVCAEEKNREYRTIDAVRDLLSCRQTYTKSIELMQQVKTHGGVIERLGHSLTWHVDRELGSVLANVQRHTEAFDSPVIAANLASSTFDPRSLRTGRVTIYLCLPHDRLDTLAPVMRLWIGVILRSITQGRPTEKNPVLFLLDEAAHLGKIRVLEQAVTLMRGMGIRLWFFFQSLNQVNEVYGDKAKTILENIETQLYFAINENDNAEAISKKIGDATISVVSKGTNTGHTRPLGGDKKDAGSVSSGSNTNVSELGRRVLKPEELMRLPQEVALVFHKNMPVIPVHLLKYYNHPSFQNRGTGRQPGIDRTASQKAMCLLMAGVLLVVLAVYLPPFDLLPGRPVRSLPRVGQSVPVQEQRSREQRWYSPAEAGEPVFPL